MKQKITEEVCPDCHGTGEIDVMSPVYPGEPHMAYLGDKVICACRINDDQND